MSADRRMTASAVLARVYVNDYRYITQGAKQVRAICDAIVGEMAQR